MNKINEELLNILLARSKPLQIRKELETLEYSNDDAEKYLLTELATNENSSEIIKWRIIFSNWDNAEGAWTENTLPRSEKRRCLILKRLGIEDTILGKDLSKKIALNEPQIELAVISDAKHEDWVTGNRIPVIGFWESYKQYLITKKKWTNNAVAKLDTSTTRILNHLIDPLYGNLVRVKGLVVGYVQSGKTANYSALIAKAVDVGYRLIIILSGRTDILRNQTQARLDFELSGWTSLDADEQQKYRDKSLYEHQNYQEKFVNYNGAQRFLRWTKTDKDFDPGSIALHDTGNPCIAVLKKIPNRLKKFAEILGKSEWRAKPVLLIDDESDDASINTSKNDITKTAKLIDEILKASDASQYVGYTATPYANVFIRPDSVRELFPSDFVICLDRPEHYMGALETFDIGDCEIENSENIFYSSNEKSFIRVINEENDEKENPLADLPKLPEAIDSFILSGAIKKWRETNCKEMRFKHHTMLINTDRLKKHHKDMAIDVEDLLNRLYPDKKLDAVSNQRLNELWTSDFLPVSSARVSSTDVPESWDALKPFTDIAIKRITSEKPRIVNCEYKEDTPDFEEPGGCWAILIGGQKLSRGYTIEGLTTSYFSRKPGQLDTLVQMARWYGFRKNYKDLVRLYIPETLPRGIQKRSSLKKKTVTKSKEFRLLAAFRFGAKVEEAFRQNLISYSYDLRPEDIPPLVQYEFDDFPQDFKYLKPTAKNKMRHVKFETLHLGGVIKTVTRIGGIQSQKLNQKQLVKLLDSCYEPLTEKELLFEDRKETVLTGLTYSHNYLEFITNIQYSDINQNEKQIVIKEQIEALGKMAPIPWRIIMFFQKTSIERLVVEEYSLPNWKRNYEHLNGVTIYEKPLNPPHREISAWLAKHDAGINLKTDDSSTLELQSEKQGVIYLVPFTNYINNDFYYLWCAVYPGKGKAGAYRVIQTNQNTAYPNN